MERVAGAVLRDGIGRCVTPTGKPPPEAVAYLLELGLVGTWWSGQEHRVLSGIDGVLLVVVIGEGKLVVPVDFAIRRPNPIGFPIGMEK